MIYLSVALVVLALIFTVRPPSITITFNQNKTIKIDDKQEPTTSEPTEEEQREIEDLEKEYNAQPTLDDVARAIADSIHALGGDDE